MNHKKKASKKYDAEGLMLNVARSLIRDFRSNLDEPFLHEHLYAALASKDVRKVRQIVSTMTESQQSVAQFKADYQLASVMKRYRFVDDLYSDAELVKMSIDKFMGVQDHIRAKSSAPLSEFSESVVEGARIYIAKVLGEYSDEEHRSLCRFGKRASVGIPARAACEAARWELPISGSHEQISWFDSEMSQVDCIQEYWINQLDSDPNRSIYQETSSLKLTLVPKSFKSLRSIMPNTTIGSYMSLGLGSMIRKRLKRIGYDISSLQMTHQYLAMRGSVHGMYTTADLSSASDTISVALVRRLFPADWFDILERSRIKTVVLPDGQSVESETFCTMGVGYTFPLQTLVFLALLKSLSIVVNGRKVRETISVYGDDMIYPAYLHSYVVPLFEDIGFVINLDKTFHEGNFRESCGGDYYHGRDVRPFQPKNGPATVGANAYEAILYKFINGLLMRWSEYEIGGTLELILAELGKVTGAAKVVPVDFPDDSGIKCPSLSYWKFLSNRSDVSKPKYIGHGIFRFSYLRLVPETRKEERHGPYLWLALRATDATIEFEQFDSERRYTDHPTNFQRAVNDAVGVVDDVSPLQWVPHDNLTVRSSISGRRLRRLLSVVTVSHTGRYTRRSGSSGFEDRRQPAF